MYAQDFFKTLLTFVCVCTLRNFNVFLTFIFSWFPLGKVREFFQDWKSQGKVKEFCKDWISGNHAFNCIGVLPHCLQLHPSVFEVLITLLCMHRNFEVHMYIITSVVFRKQMGLLSQSSQFTLSAF